MFPNDWKKGNVVPVFENDDKQILKNYRPISLLPMCGKIFQKLIFKEIFKYFIENDSISPNQSGFKPGDSCINQLLSIAHDIYKSFDYGYEVRTITHAFTWFLSKQKTKDSIDWASLLVGQC